MTALGPQLLPTLETHRRQALQCVGVEFSAHHPEALARFYTDALSFTIVKQSPGGVELTLERCLLRLRRAQGRAMPRDSQSHDRWFRHLAIVVRDMEAAVKQVQQLAPQRVSSAPQTLPKWNKTSGGIEAFYFRDPEGHPLELIHFPPDKGRPQWHQSGPYLFQGVDHTAIVVASAAASIKFYRCFACLKPTAVAHNHGLEQARLSQLAGADLRATSLGSAATRAPSLELLEYVTPTDGRAVPANTSVEDVWASATIFARAGSDGANGSATATGTGRSQVDPDGYRVVLV